MAPLFDLLVAGGGPAGCATAIAGAELGLRVCLLHDGRRTPARRGESLPPSVRPLLERLGVFDEFLAGAPLPCYTNRSRWGAGGAAAEYDFLNEPYGSGWQIDRAAFDAMLRRAAEQAGVSLYHDAALTSAERQQGGWWQVAASGTDASWTVRGRVLVDASGRSRIIARAQGARFRSVDRLMAAVWRLSARHTTDASTLVEAVPDGWWYSALVPDAGQIAIFFTDPDLLRLRDVRSVQGARALLAGAPATARRLRDAGARISQPPLVVSAASGRLDRAGGDGWLAAGDGAATFDPISSHGVGAGLDAGIAAAAAARGMLGGAPAAVDAFDRRARQGFARYLRLWHSVYRQEDRWPDAPFWRRRHRAVLRGGDDGPAGAGPDRYNQRDGAATNEVQP